VRRFRWVNNSIDKYISLLLETAKFTDQHGFQRYGLLNVIFTFVEHMKKLALTKSLCLTDFGLDFDSIIARVYII